MKNKDISIQSWKEYWQKEKLNPLGASPSKMDYKIFNEILNIGAPLKNKDVVEIGSGTGKISALIAIEGANVTLLDISPIAIENSKILFNNKGLKGEFIEGDMFNIPLKDNSFDIVWNAGVLEHFKENEQVDALKEMARICKKGGFVITFNPSNKAFFYKKGKEIAEKRGLWEYGPEYPIETLKNIAKKSNLHFIKEYQILPYEQIGFLRYYSPHISKIVNILTYPFSLFSFTEKIFLGYFGGYLLVSVLKKK